MSATTQKLNYSEVSPQASSSRAVRTETVPTNGSSFNMNQEIILDLPSNLNNTFCDFQSSYIKATVGNADGDDFKFSAGGFPTCIKQIILELGGQTLSLTLRFVRFLVRRLMRKCLFQIFPL